MSISLQPTFLHISPTFVVPLILSFLILSSLVTPLIRLNILISATSNFFSCAFFTTLVSALYIIAGLTTVLYTSDYFPFDSQAVSITIAIKTAVDNELWTALDLIDLTATFGQ